MYMYVVIADHVEMVTMQSLGRACSSSKESLEDMPEND